MRVFCLVTVTVLLLFHWLSKDTTFLLWAILFAVWAEGARKVWPID